MKGVTRHRQDPLPGLAENTAQLFKPAVWLRQSGAGSTVVADAQRPRCVLKTETPGILHKTAEAVKNARFPEKPLGSRQPISARCYLFSASLIPDGQRRHPGRSLYSATQVAQLIRLNTERPEALEMRRMHLAHRAEADELRVAAHELLQRSVGLGQSLWRWLCSPAYS